MMVSISVLHFLVFVVSLWGRVEASNLRHGSGNERRIPSNDDPRVLQDNARIFVRYLGPRGHRLAKKCAKRVVRDKDDDDVMIIEGSGSCINDLIQNEDISEAEFDNEIFPLVTSVRTGRAKTTLTIPTIAQENLSRTRHQRQTEEELVPWGLEMIQASDLELGDNEVVVCIVDSGIAFGHPDFDPDMISGTDTVKFWGPHWEWATDKVGHGTHVAGTIAALAGNDLGIKGVGNFTLHITRALGDDGRGYESDIYEAVEQCVEKGAQVINLSLGGRYMSHRSSRLYKEIVQEKGIILVAAAGNDGSTTPLYPASHPDVISVGAVYEWGTRMSFSNRGNQLEFAAPGHNILSTSISAKAVHTDSFAFPAVPIQGVPDGFAIGELVHCNADDKKCKRAKDDGICLMTKDADISIQSMLQSCEKGGGIGAIIFHSNSDSNMENWSVPFDDDGSISIPAVAIKKANGMKLMESLGQVVTMGDADNDGVEYTYTTMSGTSMASPHVAASAALLVSHFPACTNHQIRYAMATTAYNPNTSNYSEDERTSTSDSGCDEDYGYGIIKTKDAYDWLMEHDCATWDVPEISHGGCTTL